MKYVVSRESLVKSVDLAIINKNVTKLYQKSAIVQITASKECLKLNVESTAIKTEVILLGNAETTDGSDYGVAFVDCVQFKSLINTLTSEVVSFEFVSGGLVIYSEKSKFMLSNIINVNAFNLESPNFDEEPVKNPVPLELSGWRTLQNKQLYALANPYTTKPVFTRAWIGSNSTILVCNVDDGIYTMSERVTLGEDCLLTDTIINMIASMPDGAELYTNGNHSYYLVVDKDSFRYVSKFTPDYEGNGLTYHSEMIVGKIEEQTGKIVIPKDQIAKFLTQVSIVSSNTADNDMYMQFSEGRIHFKSVNIDCSVDSSVVEQIDDFDVKLNCKRLYTALSHFDENDLVFSVIRNDETAVALCISDGDTDVMISAKLG